MRGLGVDVGKFKAVPGVEKRELEWRTILGELATTPAGRAS